MPANRTVVLALAALGLAALAGTAVYLLSRDDPAPVTGDLIAYGCREPKNPWYAVCLISVDGAGRKRVTSRLETSTPAWSPDGRRIAFTRNEEVGEYTTFSDDDVFAIDADGDDLQQLTRERDGRSAGQPTWSPDGSRIAYVDGRSVASGTPSRPGALFVMNADGTDARRLTRGSADTDPAWSPDGGEIAFARCQNVASPTSCSLDLYVMESEGGAARRVTRTPGVFEAAPAWSPDGSRIAFARWTLTGMLMEGAAGIYVMHRDGTGVKLVLEHQHFSSGLYSLAWSPDGRTLAFQTSPSRQCTAISLVDIKTRVVRPLTSCTRQKESTVSPAWQPSTRSKKR